MYGDETSIIENLQVLKRTDDDKVRQIGLASDFAQVKEDTRTVPALFVMNIVDARKNPKAATTCGKHSYIEHFRIIYGVDNTASKRSNNDHAQLRKLRKVVRTRLEALTPTGNNKHLVFLRGKHMHYNAKTLWWEDEFSTEYND